MIEALYYFVFVIVPVFLLGFQALLLPVFFVFAQFVGAETALLSCAAVAAFGAVSAAGWWYLLVKREELQADKQ